MKRFIRYLYEYENEKRIRNVGFIKVETGCEETIVHMQAKGFHNWDERRLVLYLFYVENDGIVVISKGEISLTSPILSWNCRFSKDDVGGQENYSRICGVLIETGNGKRMAATWNDEVVNVSKMRKIEPEYNREAECHCDAGREEENTGRDAPGETRLCPAPELAGQAEEETGRDAPGEARLRPAPKPAGQEEEEAGREIVKISRQDISRLPRCEWKLANNKFLMHGYHNFHHLLLIDNGNYLKLGVPGIYHIEEAKCAEIFGFCEFISAEELEIASTDDENFGYWCRPVRGRRYW